MFGSFGVMGVPLDATLNPDEGKSSLETPGFFLRRSIKAALPELVGAPTDWESVFAPERGLLSATRASSLGSFTLTSLEGEVSLFLHSEDRDYDLSGMLSGADSDSLGVHKLADALVSAWERRNSLVRALPSLAELPVVGVSKVDAWLLSQSREGAYLYLSDSSKMIQVSCASVEGDGAPYKVLIEIPNVLKRSEATSEIVADSRADGAVRALIEKARQSPEWVPGS
jgi:hypothetical protein